MITLKKQSIFYNPNFEQKSPYKGSSLMYILKVFVLIALLTACIFFIFYIRKKLNNKKIRADELVEEFEYQSNNKLLTKGQYYQM